MRDLQSQSKTEVVSYDSDTIFQVACLDTEDTFFYIPVVYCVFAADFLFLEQRRAHSDFTVFNGRYSPVVEGKYPVKSILETYT